MSLKAISRMVEDDGLIARVAAAAAAHGDLGKDYRAWAASMMWDLAHSEGWSEAYARGLADENFEGDLAEYAYTVGRNEDYITDDMIISGVAEFLSKKAEKDAQAATDAQRDAAIRSAAEAEERANRVIYEAEVLREAAMRLIVEQQNANGVPVVPNVANS